MAGLASAALILFVMLIPFFAFRNVSRELGRGRLEAMVFGMRMDLTEPAASPIGAALSARSVDTGHHAAVPKDEAV